MIAAKDLTRYRLQQIVTAREDDLLRIAPPSSIADLEKYGQQTAAQLLLLQVCTHQMPLESCCPHLELKPQPLFPQHGCGDHLEKVLQLGHSQHLKS